MTTTELQKRAEKSQTLKTYRLKDGTYLVESSDELRANLRRNTAHFRRRMAEAWEEGNASAYYPKGNPYRGRAKK